MTNEDIEEQIAIRKAEGRRLFYPAKMLAIRLGEERPKKHGSIMVFKAGIGKEFFEIHYDTYAPNLSIYNCEGDYVLNFSLGNITCYKPGVWQEYMLSFAKPILKNIEDEKRMEKEQKARQRLEAWGL